MSLRLSTVSFDEIISSLGLASDAATQLAEVLATLSNDIGSYASGFIEIRTIATSVPFGIMLSKLNSNLYAGIVLGYKLPYPIWFRYIDGYYYMRLLL